jgi:hypothetical protein
VKASSAAPAQATVELGSIPSCQKGIASDSDLSSNTRYNCIKNVHLLKVMTEISRSIIRTIL